MGKSDEFSAFFGFPVDWATFPVEVPQLYIEVFGAIMGGPKHFGGDLLDFETEVLWGNLSTLDALLWTSSSELSASYGPVRKLIAWYIAGLGDVRFGGHHPDIGRPNMHGRPVTVGDRNFIPFVRGMSALVHRLSSDLAGLTHPRRASGALLRHIEQHRADGHGDPRRRRGRGSRRGSPRAGGLWRHPKRAGQLRAVRS